MNRRLSIISFILLLCVLAKAQSPGFVNASDFGFSPDSSGRKNVEALQKAVDQTGTIVISQPGIYKVAGTTFIGSNTTIEFGNGVILQKVKEPEGFSHVFLNKGALTRTYDEHIIIRDLVLSINGVEHLFEHVFGLRGQLGFFYVKDLKIEGFRCYDLGSAQFGLQVCTFEDLIITDAIIKGKKDGVHLGRGNRFTISNAVFETIDDALALNAHDYATSNPELGWIENGVVEKCWDLAGNQRLLGYFCRILAGGWIDWREGMEVQNADAVVSNGRIYRVEARLPSGRPDGKNYISKTRPTHTEGMVMLDSIKWVMTQEEVVYSAGVRNVTFRDIYMEKPRTSFSIHFDVGMWSRSYYPGAEIPMQKQLAFDNIRVLHNNNGNLIRVNTPIDVINISNSSLMNTGISFNSNNAMPEYFPTKIIITGTVFNADSEMMLLRNTVANKEIYIKTSGNTALSNDFCAKVSQGNGKVIIDSDLNGLK